MFYRLRRSINVKRFDSMFQNAIASLPGQIAALPGFPQRERRNLDDGLPLLFARHLTRRSAVRYLWWRISGRSRTTTVEMRARSKFHSYPDRGPKFMLRGSGAKSNDYGVAYEIFVHRFYAPPVWFPREGVKLIVDLGANVGMSCLWWVSNYQRAQVIAFEPHPHHAAAARANFVLNGFGSRIELHQAAVGSDSMTAHLSDEGAASSILSNGKPGFEVEVVNFFELFSGRRIDILKMDIEGSETELMADPRFAMLDIGTVVMEWHPIDECGRGGRDWCIRRLEACGFHTYVTDELGPCGIVWGYSGRVAAIEASSSRDAMQA